MTIVTAALLGPRSCEANLARVETERDRLAAGLADAGWPLGPSVTNFLLVASVAGTAAAAAEELLPAGSCRAPSASGTSSPSYLRFTVRTPRERPAREAARQLSSEIQA